MNEVHFTGRVTKRPKVFQREKGNSILLSVQVDTNGRNRLYKIVKCYSQLANDLEKNINMFTPDTRVEIKGSMETEVWGNSPDDTKNYKEVVWADSVSILSPDEPEHGVENELNNEPDDDLAPF